MKRSLGGRRNLDAAERRRFPHNGQAVDTHPDPAAVLYLTNFIDRNNIGFAVIGGMNADLHINNADAGLAGGVFYVGYLILQVPGGILAERFDVKRLIVTLALSWGVLAS